VALRRPALDPGEPWVLVRDVLAEATGVDPSRVLDGEAAVLARSWRGVRYDWCGRPAVSWSRAAELLDSIRGEQARMVGERAQVVADQASQMLMPFGCVQIERPGEPTWTSPAMVRNPAFDGVPAVSTPGAPG